MLTILVNQSSFLSICPALRLTSSAIPFWQPSLVSPDIRMSSFSRVIGRKMRHQWQQSSNGHTLFGICYLSSQHDILLGKVFLRIVTHASKGEYVLFFRLSCIGSTFTSQNLGRSLGARTVSERKTARFNTQGLEMDRKHSAATFWPMSFWHGYALGVQKFRVHHSKFFVLKSFKNCMPVLT